jgi:cytochrome b561
MMERHELIGWLLLACIVLHVLAGLKHHFIDRDGTLRRMLPH